MRLDIPIICPFDYERWKNAVQQTFNDSALLVAEIPELDEEIYDQENLLPPGEESEEE